MKQRAWHFSLTADEVGPFVEEYGWVEREQVGAAEFVWWYVEPADRDLPVMEIERFHHTEKILRIGRADSR
ncbi:MAG TPA: hypothetical protein VI076_02265 [Actinopolymorphaceae bacterium]